MPKDAPTQPNHPHTAPALPGVGATLDLGAGTRLVLHDGYVETMFPDGTCAGAYRTGGPDAYAQAEEQGYTPDDPGLWASLVEHEALHTLVARVVYGLADSPVLLQQAGHHVRLPYWQRLHEEAIILSLQLYLNTHMCTKPLDPWLPRLIPLAREIRLTLGVAALLPIEHRQVQSTRK